MELNTTTRVPSDRLPVSSSVRSGTAFLTILSGQGAGTIVALRRTRTVVGRGENADLRVIGDTISRNHAQLNVDHEGFVRITDIHSRNGSFVNGVMVRSEVLRDGDRVLLGGDLVVDVRYGLADIGQPANDAHQRPPQESGGMHALALPGDASFDHEIACYERLIESRRQGASCSSLALALDGEGSLRRQAGEHSRAQECHRAAQDALEGIPGVTGIERAHTTIRLARALLEGGDTQGASEALDAAESLFASGGVQPGERIQLYVARALLCAITTPEGVRVEEARARSELKAIDPRSSFYAIKSAVLERELEALTSSRAAAQR